MTTSTLPIGPGATVTVDFCRRLPRRCDSYGRIRHIAFTPGTGGRKYALARHTQSELRISAAGWQRDLNAVKQAIAAGLFNVVAIEPRWPRPRRSAWAVPASPSTPSTDAVRGLTASNVNSAPRVVLRPNAGVNSSTRVFLAHVIPCGVGDRSAVRDGEEGLAQLNSRRRKFRDSRNVAVEECERRGFRVLKETGATSLVIAGTAAAFRNKLGLKFQLDDGGPLWSADDAPRGMPVFVPTNASREDLENLDHRGIASVVFPEPVALHGRPSAVPPRTSLFHLLCPYHIAQHVGADAAHARRITGRGVKVAMIDSGFAWSSHPYFDQFSARRLRRIGDASVRTDPVGHGTAMSACLLAVAPGVNLLGISCRDPALALASARKRRVKLISNSWGTGLRSDGPGAEWRKYYGIVKDNIEACAAAGIAVLFSSGNLGKASFTASHWATVSVGGVNVTSHGAYEASDYTTSWSSVRYASKRPPEAVHVPEVCGLCGSKPDARLLMLPVPLGSEFDAHDDGVSTRDGWALLSGSSAACAIAAGVAALILQQCPDITVNKLRRRLWKCCQPVTVGTTFSGDVAGPGYNRATGFGLVNAANAVVYGVPPSMPRVKRHPPHVP